jgi:hypothetical protein
MITTKECRSLLAQHGPVESQPPSDWMGDIPLPAAVERFYEEVGPMDVAVEAHGDAYFFPRLASLWDIQAGYRYNALSGSPLPNWNEEWLVVADHGGDPFIFSQATGEVLLASQGGEVWTPRPLFADLVEMAAVLATLGNVARAGGGTLECDTAVTALAALVGERAQAMVDGLVLSSLETE